MDFIYSYFKFLCYIGKIVIKNYRNRKIFADKFIIFDKISWLTSFYCIREN